MKTHVKKADLVLIAGVVAVAVVMGLGLWLFAPTGAQVQVTVEDQVVLTLPLDQDTTVTVPGIEGENILEVADGQVRMHRADCPDGLCVKHRPIRRGGESIVCLPHRVTVTVVGGRAAPVDGEV